MRKQIKVCPKTRRIKAKTEYVNLTEEKVRLCDEVSLTQLISNYDKKEKENLVKKEKNLQSLK